MYETKAASQFEIGSESKEHMDYLEITRNIFAVIGAIFTVYRVYTTVSAWKEKRAELKRKEALLENSDYFLAHIIHLGGNFSHTHSMEVYSNEEGGYYFNPPKNFVEVSFNRGGDSIVVLPTELSQRFKFEIDSFGSDLNSLEKTAHRDICHLPRNSIKNEWIVKFVKAK